MFPDDAAAERWFEEQRWPDGIRDCPDCGSTRTGPATHKTMPYRCRDCRKYFSVKKGTVMEGSNLGCQKWAVAAYQMVTNLKGVSSMKLHRDLDIRQATAWYMMRASASRGTRTPALSADPSRPTRRSLGALRRTASPQEAPPGRGPVARWLWLALDRATGQSRRAFPSTDAATLQPFVVERTAQGAEVFTDDHGAYRGMPGVKHRTVKHSVGEWVDGQAHTNGVESFGRSQAWVSQHSSLCRGGGRLMDGTVEGVPAHLGA